MSVPLEKRTAGFILHRARNLAHIISRALGKGKDVETQADDDDDSKVEDVDEDALVVDSPVDFLHAEEFILQSAAFVAFKDSLRALLQSRLLSETEEEINTEANTGLVWSQIVDINWRCVSNLYWTAILLIHGLVLHFEANIIMLTSDDKRSCGELFSEQVIKYRPGAAQELAPFAHGGTTIDIEYLADSVDVTASVNASYYPQRCQNQQSPQDGLNPAGTTSESKDNKTMAAGDEKDNEFILFCNQQETEKTLYHADITMALCDFSSYHILHEKYYGMFKSHTLRWFHFEEISKVGLVKFHPFWSTYVSINSKDFGVLPPSLSTEY